MKTKEYTCTACIKTGIIATEVKDIGSGDATCSRIISLRKIGGGSHRQRRSEVIFHSGFMYIFNCMNEPSTLYTNTVWGEGGQLFFLPLKTSINKGKELGLIPTLCGEDVY